MGAPIPSTTAPRNRFSIGDKVGIGIVVAMLIVVGAVFGVGALEHPQCPFPLQHCPAGSNPLGAFLSIGNATGSCSPSVGRSHGVCSYTFPLVVSGTPTPSASELSFSLVNASGDLVVARAFSAVTLITSSGCSVGSWNATTGAWGTTSNPRSCHNVTTASPMSYGEQLVLYPIPSSSLSLSGKAYHLIATAHGPDFTGSTNGYWSAIP